MQQKHRWHVYAAAMALCAVAVGLAVKLGSPADQPPPLSITVKPPVPERGGPPAIHWSTRS